MSDFLKSNPALDAAINGAQTVQEMREAMLSTLEKQGTVVRNRAEGDPYDIRMQPGQPLAPSQPAASAEPIDHNRVSRFIYPGGNDRFEVFGADEAEIAEKERKIRALYTR